MPPNRQRKWPEGRGFCVLDGPRTQKMGFQDRNTILLMVNALLFGTLDPQGVFMCTPEDERRFLSRRLTKRRQQVRISPNLSPKPPPRHPSIRNTYIYIYIYLSIYLSIYIYTHLHLALMSVNITLGYSDPYRVITGRRDGAEDFVCELLRTTSTAHDPRLRYRQSRGIQAYK